MFVEPFNSIRVCEVQIIARNREEADKIFYGQSHKFFDQDLNMIVTESMHGYRTTVGISQTGSETPKTEQVNSEPNKQDSKE